MTTVFHTWLLNYYQGNNYLCTIYYAFAKKSKSEEEIQRTNSTNDETGVNFHGKTNYQIKSFTYGQLHTSQKIKCL